MLVSLREEINKKEKLKEVRCRRESVFKKKKIYLVKPVEIATNPINHVSG